MTAATNRPGRRMRDASYLFLILLATWLMVTSSLHWQEVAVGAVLSFVLALFLARTYAELGLPPLSPRRVWFFAVYVGVLAVEIVKANIDVACRVLHPALPIKPGIVTIKTELKHDIAKMMLANSITLTPGTFTLDIQDDALLIHWIFVRSEDTEEATRMIGARFENCLRRIFA